MTARTAFDLEFPTWPPPLTAMSRQINSPAGSVRIAKKNGVKVRMIKIRTDGPPAKRWMRLARFWWLTHREAVPEGKRVGHFDLDSLNDDPANYALFTPGDVIASHHLENPEWSQRQHEKAAKGTAKSNRDRSEVFRALNFVRGRWYAVDRAKMIVINQPFKKRWQVYATHGDGVEAVASERLESAPFDEFDKVDPDGNRIASHREISDRPYIAPTRTQGRHAMRSQHVRDLFASSDVLIAGGE